MIFVLMWKIWFELLDRFSFTYGVSRVVPFSNTKGKKGRLEAYCPIGKLFWVIFICSSSLVIKSTIWRQVLSEILQRKILHNLLIVYCYKCFILNTLNFIKWFIINFALNDVTMIHIWYNKSGPKTLQGQGRHQHPLSPPSTWNRKTQYFYLWITSETLVYLLNNKT